MHHAKVLTPAIEQQFARFLATQPRIILGSSSTSRRAIMDDLMNPFNYKYETQTADIDEKAIRDPVPENLVMQLGHAKAAAIISKMRSSTASQPAAGDANQSTGEVVSGFLLTCDQVVVHEGCILEKPTSPEEARTFISGYARAPASTVGSVVCTNLATGTTCQQLDLATIHMNPVPDDSIEALIKEGDIFWCAGGLMIEHPLVEPLITKIEGTEDSVRGLSKLLVVQLLLQAAGFQ